MFQTLRLGIYSLLLQKLRSALAVLGIVIGITISVWLVAIGEGISFQLQERVKELGATNIMVRSIKPSQNSSSAGSSLFVSYGILRADHKRFKTNIPWIKDMVPMREIRQEIRFDDRTGECRLVGCTPEYFDLNRLRMARGRFLTDRDAEGPDNVCVVADGTARALFGYENPIGKSLQIGTDFYVIVGQTENRNPTAAIGGSMSSQDYNLDVYIPLETLKVRIGDMVFLSRSGSREGEIVELSQITLSVNSIEEVDETADIVRFLLKKYHENDDYAVVVPKELLEQAQMLRVVLGASAVFTAIFTLIVGGIGIMNIMLATVTERTREIGIRRALGATRKHIVRQFLIESSVLTFVGGMLGILLGYSIGPVWRFLVFAFQTGFADVFQKLPAQAQAVFIDGSPRVAWWSIVASLVISFTVGVIAGLYPAIRAAYMDPIEALRHE